MKSFKELRQQVAEKIKYAAGNLNYAQDLDLAQKNMARLAKQEKGQEKKDYMAVARALNQGNLGAVKKIIKGISTDEIRADILNVLVGYNNLIAKMYPKAVDAKGNLKSGMSVSKMIKDDVNEGTYMITVRKGGPGGKDLNVKVKGKDKNDAVTQWRKKNKKYKNDEVEVSESDANWAKSLEKINKQKQLDKISDKDKETLMKIAALLGKEKKRR